MSLTFRWRSQLSLNGRVFGEGNSTAVDHSTLSLSIQAMASINIDESFFYCKLLHSDSLTLNCEIKRECDDFHVNEISLSEGRVVHLTTEGNVVTTSGADFDYMVDRLWDQLIVSRKRVEKKDEFSSSVDDGTTIAAATTTTSSSITTRLTSLNEVFTEAILHRLSALNNHFFVLRRSQIQEKKDKADMETVVTMNTVIEHVVHLDLSDKTIRRDIYHLIFAQFPFLKVQLKEKDTKNDSEKEKEGNADSRIVVRFDKDLSRIFKEVPFLPDTNITSIVPLLKQKDGNENLKVFLGVDFSKEQRTKLYQLFSKHFRHLHARTIDNSEGRKCIEVSIKKNNKRKAYHLKSDTDGGRKQNSVGNTTIIDLYLACRLSKRNIEQFRAMNNVASALNVPASRITFAGIKDKKACTEQDMVIALSMSISLSSDKEVLREQMKECVQSRVSQLRNLCRTGMNVREYRIVEKPLQLGQLLGNEFVIKLRGLQSLQEAGIVEERFQWLVENGFPNFYGPQRFTTCAAQEEEEKISSGHHNTSLSAQMGRWLIAGDFRQVLKAFLSQRFLRSDSSDLQFHLSQMFEGKISTRETLDRIVNSNGNAQLEEVTILRAMIRFGAEFTNQKKNALEFKSAIEQTIPYHMRELLKNAYQSWLWNRSVCDRLKESTMAIPGDLCSDEKIKGVVRILQQEDCDVEGGHQLSIVMPLKGKKVMFPTHALGKRYEESDMRVNQLMPGAYRSCKARILNSKAMQTVQEDDNSVSIILQFTLPPGSYATSVIRELCRNNHIM